VVRSGLQAPLRVWGCSSVVEHLSSTHKALQGPGFNLGTAREQNKTKRLSLSRGGGEKPGWWVTEGNVIALKERAKHAIATGKQSVR
jgi:hypothetical protein